MRSAMLALSLALAMPAASAFGATFVVNKLTDDNGPCTISDCSVREAILAAAAAPGADIVELPPGRHLLSIPGPEEFAGLTGDLNINGTQIQLHGSPDGGTIIDAQGIERVLTVSNTTAVLQDITFTGGAASFGGGLFFSFADVAVIRCSVEGNSADAGGGIYASSTSFSLLFSLVSGNTATVDGGGLIRAGTPGGTDVAVIGNSTFSGNSAGGNGGAIHSISGGLLQIGQATFRGNTSPSGTLTHIGDTETDLTNNLIEGPCVFDQGSSSTSHGGNLESPGNTCRLTAGGDAVGVADLGLTALGDFGGTTRTHALLASSPAIDAAPTCVLLTDQRGFPRPLDGDGDGVAACDSGAYELDGTPTVAEVPTAGAAGLLALAGLLAAAACLLLAKR